MKIKHKEGWDNFLQLCLSTKDEKTLSTLLDAFMTMEEKENLAMRYLLIQELIKSEKPQRQIAKDLNISIAKITRGSNVLKKISPKVRQILQSKSKK
jgi:TrpR family transcriptional regulator, trp operon repressor